jgi:antirestriction protein ArdC
MGKRVDGQNKLREMSAAAATTFERKSDQNAAILRNVSAERGCSCEPYKDWFTLRRWNAQGYRVREGEHGVRLVTIREDEVENEDTGERLVRRRRWMSVVFCRCQVHRPNTSND